MIGADDPVPLVSVCIRTQNRPEELRGAIASALAQEGVELEVIVSDDGGRSEAAVRQFADPRLRYAPLTDCRGPAAALRNGFDTARGSLLALLDDDDRWDPGFLAAAVAPFARDPDLGVVFTDVHLAIGDRLVRRSLRLPHGRHDRLLATLVTSSPVPSSAAVQRRVVWEQGQRSVPLRDGALGAATMWVRAAAAEWPFFYLDDARVQLRLHHGQVTRTDAQVARAIAFLEGFAFPDEIIERARRERLSRQRMASAGFALMAGHPRDAVRTIARARADAGGRLTLGHWRALARPFVLRLPFVRPGAIVGRRASRTRI